MDSPQCGDKSIFHAQAEEIRVLGNKAEYEFQYTGLTDWRSVACRVLESIGWTTECAYGGTLYPKRTENAGINWANISWSTPNPQRRLDTTDMTQVYIIAWEEGSLAISTTAIKHGASKLTGSIHLLGKTIQKNPRALSGLALAAGLCYLEHVQFMDDGSGGPMQGGVRKAIELIVEFPPLHEPEQIRRWKIYGAPDPPSPEQEVINSILKKWTVDPIGCAIIIKGSFRTGRKYKDSAKRGKKNDNGKAYSGRICYDQFPDSKWR